MSSLVVAFIFARGGSVGVPRKNLREVGGKPLIGYAIESALAAEHIDRVMVSTDDPEIAEVARQYGAEVPFERPKHLAESNSAEWDAWKHAAEYLQSEEFGSETPEMFISVPTTSPLRNSDDLDRLIEEYRLGGADLVFGVTDSVRNPHMNIVTIDEDGYAHVAIGSTSASPHPTTRQSAPSTYDVTTVGYAVNLDYVVSASTLLEGRVRTVHIPIERSWDIDTKLDLEIADFLVRRTSGLED